MKRTVGTVLAFAIGANAAADLARAAYLAPAPYSAFSWASLHSDLGFRRGAVPRSVADPDRLLGGVHTGYNWQTAQFVHAVETDLGADDPFAAFEFANPWFRTLRGRFTINVEFSGMAGLGYDRLDFAGLLETGSHLGGSVDIGGEGRLSPHWSAKVEYLFVSRSDERYVTGLDDFESKLRRFDKRF